jgi:hypothetical protein
VSSSALSSDNGLIFHWEAPRPRQLAIAGFLFASIVGHAFCFYMFQIIYPPAVALLPPPAHVTVIASNTEEGRTLLRWIEAEDPALASITQRPPDAKTVLLPALQHVPSYLNTQPSLKKLPPLISDLRVPSSQPSAPVPLARARKAPAMLTVPTTVTFSSELADLGAPQEPGVKWSASTREPPQSAEFHVAVTDRGLLRYCFLERSSGDAALDEQAQKYLALCRFTGSARENSATEKQLIWAMATFEWGNDVTLPPSSSSEAPAP